MTDDVKKLMQAAANGNKDCQRFLEAWHDFAHLIDDLVDKDQARNDEEMSGVLVRFIFELSANPFYQQHKAQLFSIIVQAFNAWVDSNRCPRPTERDVLKGYWHEVIYHCVFITGGWSALRAATSAFREYDYETDALKILDLEGGK